MLHLILPDDILGEHELMDSEHHPRYVAQEEHSHYAGQYEGKISLAPSRLPCAHVGVPEGGKYFRTEYRLKVITLFVIASISVILVYFRIFYSSQSTWSYKTPSMTLCSQKCIFYCNNK